LILRYEKTVSECLGDEDRKIKEKEDYFSSSTLQINKVNKDCKSVSGTLARAALTSIALDGNQVKQFMEDDLGKKKKKGEGNEGEVGDILTTFNALQHLYKALELAYQLPSNSNSTRQTLEKRLLIRQILHKISEHHITISNPPNYELASNYLNRVPGKNFQTYSLFTLLNEKHQEKLSTSSSFFNKNHKNNDNRIKSSKTESDSDFGKIDDGSEEDEEEMEDVENNAFSEGNSLECIDKDLLEVLGLIEKEKEIQNFHDADLVRRFLPVDFVQSMVFIEFFENSD